MASYKNKKLFKSNSSFEGKEESKNTFVLENPLDSHLQNIKIQKGTKSDQESISTPIHISQGELFIDTSIRVYGDFILGDNGVTYTSSFGDTPTHTFKYNGILEMIATNFSIVDGELVHKKISDDANGAVLVLQKERSALTAQDNDYAGNIQFKAYDDESTPDLMTVGEIRSQILDVTGSDEIARLEMRVLSDEFSDADTPTTFLRADGLNSGGFGQVNTSIGAGGSSTMKYHSIVHEFQNSALGTDATRGVITLEPRNGGVVNPNIKIESNSDDGDYLKASVGTNGASNISTVDDSGSANAHLTLEPQGDLVVKATSGVFIKEAASAANDRTAYGQIWVKNDDPNNLYFTDDTGQDVQITNNGSLAAAGGTSRFHFVTGGYVLNRTSTTTYYFQFRPLGESWSNAESSPTSISGFDVPAALWIAPADGKITNLTMQGYANDTGATDPFKFYIFRGTPTHNATSTTLSSFLTTSTITPGGAVRNIRHSEDFTSSNTFSAGDTFYVMWKKDSNTGSQDVYFSMTVSGEYT